jgi:hypothetical protein
MNAKIRIIRTLPSEGSPQTFNYVFESKEGEFVLELPEPTSVEDLTQNSENILTLCSMFR